MVNFPKRVTKIFVLLNDLQMEYKKVQLFYQYTTGIVLLLVLSVAVSVSIYRDTYHIALHVSRYVSYRMTAVSPQPYSGNISISEIAIYFENQTYRIYQVTFDSSNHQCGIRVSYDIILFNSSGAFSPTLRH